MSSIPSVATLALVLAVPSSAQVTSRASLSSTGAQADEGSFGPALSADGRYVAFVSDATNLVPMDWNLEDDVFVRDLRTGVTERVSVDSAEDEAFFDSTGASISFDGAFVAFASYAPDLVAGDTNNRPDVFVRDRSNGVTERVSVDSGELEADHNSFSPSISADGRYVAFASLAGNLVAGDTNGTWDVFVRDRLSGTTERVSLDGAGAQGDGASNGPWISGDGRWVSFVSAATNLVPGDTNGFSDVFVRDRQLGTTRRASLHTSGAQADGHSADARISADGSAVGYWSFATNLVTGDTNGAIDVFVSDLATGATERASVGSAGAQGNGTSLNLSISGDGRFVSFDSLADTLVAGDTNARWDVFLRDRQAATTVRLSVATGGAQGNGNSELPSISADARFVAFVSLATGLVAGDTNGANDVFVHDRAYAPFASLCHPGLDAVQACPCSNPPSAPGRGCDNSSGTGGAVLSASGVAYLSQDTLVFTTTGERPTATSIVLQGSALVASGVPYGQGVRCAGGSLKRMYTKSASGGSITAPDFGAGDPSVSTRSATLGAPIPAGQSRWYLVYYRDPNVLGGCPSSSTFNATQTGVVLWMP